MFTKSDILSQLAAMDAPRDSIVLMHTSLRLIGEVEGGAKGLLDALIEYFTAEGGLLCIPTHTGRNSIKEYLLDLTTSESHLGAFPIFATEDGRGIRTENPSHSMVIFGHRERAEKFAEGELYVDSPTSPKSCYGKIYDEGGKILLVGVNQSKNTYLHCVEEMLGVEHRMTVEKIPVKIKRKDGQVVCREIHWFDESYVGDASHRFPKYELAFRYHGCITDGFVGDAPTQLCDARKMKDVLELIKNRAGKLDPLADDAPFPPKWYCKK